MQNLEVCSRESSPRALLFPLGGRLQSTIRLHVITEAFGAFSASRIDTEWQGVDDLTWSWGTASLQQSSTTIAIGTESLTHTLWFKVTLGVKSGHAQTKFSLFLPIIQHWKNRPYYTKFYSQIIGAGLVISNRIPGVHNLFRMTWCHEINSHEINCR